MKSLIKKVVRTSIVLGAVGVAASVLGQEEASEAVQLAEAANENLGKGLAVIGGGLAVLGGGLGIGLIGKAGAEGTARQPEAGGRIFTLALITAAFVEGATLFAVLAAFLS
ncbi:MAG: ATP synthase F0 subunit C [Planctomycetota bacterium]